MTTTATNNPGSSTTTNGTTNDTTTSKAARSAPTPIEAISKIGKILDQLSASDRKRVLAFLINEGGE
jgi:hypothetical protein